MFSIAAETGWAEQRIMNMPLARLLQYRHCLCRKYDIRTRWSNEEGAMDPAEQLSAIKASWAANRTVDSATEG